MKLLESLIATIAPHDCLSCGREGVLLCTHCQGTVLHFETEQCYLCRRSNTIGRLCPRCAPKSSLTAVWSICRYDSEAELLISALKFGRAQAAAKTVAQIMSDRLPMLPEMLVVPIPTATSRVRQRGYDQSRLVAKRLAVLRGLPYSTALTRYGQSRQLGASRQQRLVQLQTAYGVVSPELVSGKHVLLVDDVLTTGATIENAAHVMLNAGARSVSAVVFARKRQ